MKGHQNETLSFSPQFCFAGVAAPALASSVHSTFDGSFLTTALQHQGRQRCRRLRELGQHARAVIQQADGSETFAYFYQDTLQPVTSGADAAQTVFSARSTTASSSPAGRSVPQR